ncbi:MAG: hypothetical protein EOP33_06635 [Rickettsiaceae bacterium]|nr:MAG: hypothetical protein EOP33_06635 [Rickettsiaceae bacterium]
MIKELDEYQKKKIKEKLSMDFFIELDKESVEKKKYIQVLDTQLDILISKFDAKGIMFYGFKIELPFLSEEKGNVWEVVHKEVEEFINYMGLSVELIEFCYMSIEVAGRKPLFQGIGKENNLGLPFIHGIFGVRSIIGENTLLILELKDIFILSFYDIKIKWLKNKFEIYKHWKFIIKQNNFKFHRFVNFSKFNSNIYGSIADEELKFEGQQAFGQVDHFISETMYVSGVQAKHPSKNLLIIYFISLYFEHKNYRIYDNKIFSKVLGLKLSWEFVCYLDNLKENHQKIFKCIKALYPQQLEDFNATELVLDSWGSTLEQIKENNSFIPEITSFDRVIEFTDGIYFLEKKFFKKFDVNHFTENLNTIFYIKGSFSELNNAKVWLNLLSDNLNALMFDELRSELSRTNNWDIEIIDKKNKT